MLYVAAWSFYYRERKANAYNFEKKKQKKDNLKQFSKCRFKVINSETLVYLVFVYFVFQYEGRFKSMRLLQVGFLNLGVKKLGCFRLD